ncbi:MAG: YdbH domain-containing protein, partial [Marinobacter sp.]
NPGIPLNNIQLAGRYRSTTEQLAAGTLVLEQGAAGLLGGNLRIEPAEWQLTETPLKILLELSDIELSQLMEVYPSEGLSGSGILRGTVPVLIGEQGVSIDAGKVEAEPPGGTLKLPAERLRSMAQNNEAMALVVQAMENFHYTVLNSTVDYDQNGKLFLGLRLEGSSPEVRDGHPIVLNINLEEDIPALLTSLQLSGRVNEAVTEKVRNLMQKRDEQNQPGRSEN